MKLLLGILCILSVGCASVQANRKVASNEINPQDPINSDKAKLNSSDVDPDLQKMFNRVNIGHREMAIVYQKKLCVPNEELGMYGPHTKALIQIFENSRYGFTPDGALDIRELSALLSYPGCEGKEIKNAYEQVNYPEGLCGRNLSLILNRIYGDQAVSRDTRISEVRGKIREIRLQHAELQNLPEDMWDQMTHDFFEKSVDYIKK